MFAYSKHLANASTPIPLSHPCFPATVNIILNRRPAWWRLVPYIRRIRWYRQICIWDMLRGILNSLPSGLCSYRSCSSDIYPAPGSTVSIDHLQCFQHLQVGRSFSEWMQLDQYLWEEHGSRAGELTSKELESPSRQALQLAFHCSTVPGIQNKQVGWSATSSAAAAQMKMARTKKGKKYIIFESLMGLIMLDCIGRAFVLI